MVNKVSFKEINESNWNEPDPTSTGFTKGKDENGWQHYTGEDYLKEIQTIVLNPTVPDDIHEQIELAKGICAYGIYFYPLFTVGMEQSIRVADSATMHLCKAMDGPRKSTNTFEKRIEWLTKQGLIDGPIKDRWHNVRKLRNYTSHPKHVSYMTPVMALGFMERVIEAINMLFAKKVLQERTDAN